MRKDKDVKEAGKNFVKFALGKTTVIGCWRLERVPRATFRRGRSSPLTADGTLAAQCEPGGHTRHPVNSQHFFQD